MNQETKSNCSVCGSENVQKEYNGERLYMECPICGRYILPHSSFCLLDNKLGYKDLICYDVRKLASYLFHNKINDRYAFVGTSNAFDAYKKHKPQTVAFLVAPETVENWYPNTIIEKIKITLLYLLKRTDYIGQQIIVTAKECQSMFFLMTNYDDNDETKNNGWGDELTCLLKYMADNGYITYNGKSIEDTVVNLCIHNHNAFSITLTVKAFDEIEKFKIKQSNNKNVFVAMKFGNETIPLRDKIKEGLEGYNVRIMDEIEHNHQIVPEMLYEIQNCRFVIAELSHHNNGAYYEAGFAYGCGKEVIHLCDRKELKDGLHFDVAQINTIVYDDISEIPQKLKRRIQATIK